jgi:large subunit ribosomal protein L31
MKPGIHPAYRVSHVKCACGATWETRSTRTDLSLDVCANCHPYFTGKQKLMDTEGRIDRFNRKWKKGPAAPAQS